MANSATPAPLRWAVIGSTGFVGSALVGELTRRGLHVTEIAAPRLRFDCQRTHSEIYAAAATEVQAFDELSVLFRDVDVVVNAAGIASPDSPATDELFGANSLLPLVAARASHATEVRQFIHLSSAAVQGDVDVLDESVRTFPFSPYSKSKALAEEVLATERETYPGVVIVRATSVQGPGRSTTRKLQSFSRSRLSTVASPGDQPSPISSIYGLTDFVIAIGQSGGPSKLIRLQPWEGGSVSTILSIASGGRNPIVVPAWICRAAVRSAKSVSKLLGGRFAGPIRRVELLWFGQSQQDKSGSLGGPSTRKITLALGPESLPTDISPIREIGILSQWYDPETGPAALPAIYARELSKQGKRVRVLTGFPNYPHGTIYPGFKQVWRSNHDDRQIAVTRVPLIPSHDSSALGRVANYLSFAFSAATLGTGALRNTDAIWVYNSPITVSLPLLLSTRFGRKPYFLHVQDLWPESLINSGMITSGAIGRIVEKVICLIVGIAERRAAVIGVSSPSAKNLILARNPRLDASKIVYLPNPTDEGLFVDVRNFAAEDVPVNSWQGKFTFMYMGAMGEAQGLATILSAAKLIESEPRIAIVLVGDGNALPKLKIQAERDKIKNVTFFGRVSKDEVPRLTASSNIQIVSLAPDEFLRYTTPSKISSIMASGVPILAQIEGDGAKLINDARSGLTVKPGDAQGIADAMLRFAGMPTQEIDSMAQSGLNYYHHNMSAESASLSILRSLEEAMK